MSLIVFLSPDDPSRALFWIDQEQGHEGADTPLAALAERVQSNPRASVCLALPGEAALTRSLNLPMKNRRDIERAAGLMIDDQQAAPIEGRVIAFGPATDGKRLVTALPRRTIELGLTAAEEVGLDPDILTTDHALLPAISEGAAVLGLGERSAVRTEEGAFTAEAGFADAVLEGQEIRRVGLKDLDPAQAPNFRTGMFAKRRPMPDLRPYLLAASLAVIAGAIFLIGSLTEGVRYASAAAEKRDAAETNFARAFPGTPVLDMERQVRNRRVTGPTSDFLPLTAVLAEVLEDQETTFLQSLTYSEDGQLTAELVFASFSDLELVTADLADRGVQIEEGADARSEDGAFVTRLFLRAS
ncbi:type II secretion system protein GspL [Parvularcula lutaonensis]|uniref:Type II secretion system protein GspL n=1 Tax=Parvularcula lutaonensis TaxID=491923 RepID=A0ABV7MEW0_9PROT|nr:type II secretion system protein GspL [Parvularcula lutaonensis]GGY52741.1 hypothetical protein GCM10007148_22460 [Parvularcula lutaonensis]